MVHIYIYMVKMAESPNQFNSSNPVNVLGLDDSPHKVLTFQEKIIPGKLLLNLVLYCTVS